MLQESFTKALLVHRRRRCSLAPMNGHSALLYICCACSAPFGRSCRAQNLTPSRPLPFSEIFWKRPAVRLDAVEQKNLAKLGCEANNNRYYKLGVAIP